MVIVMIISIVVGLALTVVGVVGCSLQPPPSFVGDYRAMRPMLLYYSLLSVYLLYNLLLLVLGRSFELGFLFKLSILLLSAYGLKCLRKTWTFNGRRFLDVATYGSVVYLMNVHVRIPSEVLVPVMFVLSLWIVALLTYTIVKFERVKEFVTFEDVHLVHVVYATTFLIGIGGEISLLILTALTSYVLYVVISKYVRPLLELGKG